MKIAEDIKYIGVNDHSIDLFEGMYRVPRGMCYNSYIVLDEKIALLDTVDEHFSEQWLENLRQVLAGRCPDYLIIQHMEPDHSANILRLVEQYPQVVLVASAKAFIMMDQFFEGKLRAERRVVADGDTLSLGRHKLQFLAAPMVHWPEVMMTYDSSAQVLFSADAFGKFGAMDQQEPWEDEARRYYFGIVGKYGLYVQKLLQKAKGLGIRQICPLHGPVLAEHLEDYLRLYDAWSRYEPEEEGVLIAYTSIYGNTKRAVLLLEQKLREAGCPKVVLRDLARCDMSEAVAEAFRYPKLVLATTTYNAGIFPAMREYIQWLTERNFCNRQVAFMENGSWAIVAAMLMEQMLEKCKGLIFTEPRVRIKSALSKDSMEQLEMLALELVAGDTVR